jgi:hypothetical protein
MLEKEVAGDALAHQPALQVGDGADDRVYLTGADPRLEVGQS